MRNGQKSLETYDLQDVNGLNNLRDLPCIFMGVRVLIKNCPVSVNISMGFFRLQTSYSKLPKKVGFSNHSIQIVFQNIENSSIHEQ